MSDLLTVIADLWERSHFPNDGGLKILGLRGCDIANGAATANDGAFDRFRDNLILFDETAGYIDHVVCTAGQPGVYWDQHQANCPKLRPCCAFYVRGVHRGEYPCLVQAGDARGTVAVIRDTKGNGSWDIADGTFDYPLDTGIHIHHAGQQNEPAVGVWSAGCTVVDDGDGPLWSVVKAAVWDAYAGQDRIPYGIAPFGWLGDGARRVLFGSVDKGDGGVTQLQQLLNDPNHDGDKLALTGVFDEATDRAYRAHQSANDETPDGVCVNPPWLVAGFPKVSGTGQVTS